MTRKEFRKSGKLATEHGFAVIVYEKDKVEFVAVSPEIAVETNIMSRGDMNLFIQMMHDENTDKCIARSVKRELNRK